MVITTILFYFVAVYSWNWHWAPASFLCGFFLLIEGSFWGANLLKVVHGGWFPLVVGAIIYTIMTTWHKGRQILSTRMLEIILPLNDFLTTVRTNPPQRVPGVAVYMSGHPQYTPPTLAQSFKHFKCIHEHLIFLFVQTVDLPHVPESNRVRFQNIGTHIYKVVIQYGFMDLPNIPLAMKGLQLDGGLSFDADHATFFLGREHIIATKREGMALWREKLFAMMSRNAQPATHFFQIPRSRVFEIGSMIDL
jgi:KUP system potassium uptake protein